MLKKHIKFLNRQTRVENKIIDILTEILIIVFAVSISIWLSNWSESRHDRKEEKEFLIGFKMDLQE